MTKRNKVPLLLAVALIWFSSCLWIDAAGAAVVSAAAAETTKAAATAPAATTAKANVTTAAAATTASTTAATTAKAAVTTAAATTTASTTAATTAKAAVTTSAAATTASTTAATTAKSEATNATVHNTTTASTAATTEKFVPFPDSQCHIPFWHNGAWHHTCIKYNNFGDFWCSLSANFTRDENWIRCKSPDLKRFQCQIPFEFEGKNHTECLPLHPDSAQGRGSHHSFWCAVVPKIVSWSAGGTDWAYCEHPGATGVVYLKEVGTKKSIPAVNNTADASKAVAVNAPSKSLSGGAASGSGSSGATAGLGAQATIGISVGVVCSVLAVAAVVAGFAIRKRRRNGGDHKALLQTREKGTYGGMDPSD